MADLRNPDSRAAQSRPVVKRFFYAHLWSSMSSGTPAEVIRFQTKMYSRATVIVRVYYAMGVYWAISAINGWPSYRAMSVVRPLWPTRWWFDWFTRTSVDIIFCLYVGASFVAMMFPRFHVTRSLYAFALLKYMGLINVADEINHNQHAWLFIALVFVLLPGGAWNKPLRTADRQYLLTVIWSSQVVVLLFYTLTGVWKIDSAVKSALHGRPSGFNFSGFSYIVANRILLSPTKPVLGAYFTRTELIGWALFVGTEYRPARIALRVLPARPRSSRCQGDAAGPSSRALRAAPMALVAATTRHTCRTRPGVGCAGAGMSRERDRRPMESGSGRPQFHTRSGSRRCSGTM